MSITTIEYQTSNMAAPSLLHLRHRHKVRAELAAARRGWPAGTTAPLALMTMAAHFAVIEENPDTPKDFDHWMDTVEEFEFVEAIDVDPTHAAPAPEPPSN